MMVPGAPNPLLWGGDPCEVYQIGHSVRFNAPDSAYLARTPSAAGNRTTWTWSGWVKPAAFGALAPFFGCGASGTGNRGVRFGFEAGYGLRFMEASAWGTTSDYYFDTNRLFRDPSAHYHIVLVFDSGNAVAADRMRLYINGVRETSFASYSAPALSFAGSVNNTVEHRLGSGPDQPGFAYANSYLSEVHFVDGQALDASSFGFFCPLTGQWRPKAYAGTYGAQGSHPDFADGSAATALALGADRSGNGNNWAPTNISVTAGAGCDWLEDTPTNVFCTLNPVAPLAAGTTRAVSNGGLDATGAGNGTYNFVCEGTLRPASGKWYWEATVVAIGGSINIGVNTASALANPNDFQGNASTCFIYQPAGTKRNNAVSTAYGAAFTTGDTIGVAIDADSGKLYFSKNGVWQNAGDPAAGVGEAFSGLAGAFVPVLGNGGEASTSTVTMNFGQRAFAYAAPIGFKAMCTKNLPLPTIKMPKRHFDCGIYTGDGTPKTIGGFRFQPDLIWTKNRSSGTFSHALFNSIVGGLKRLSSNLAEAENNGEHGYVSAFNSDGYAIAGGSTDYGELGANANTYVTWLWKAGGAAVANNAGSIAAMVSANVQAGFSMVKYTGTGANGTVGHGLGVAPKLVIVKSMNLAAQNWHVYHASVDAAPANYALGLNLTNAKTLAPASWNNTAPTASVFSVGTDTATNNNTNDHIAYCFSEVPGFSKFGSYTGNGSADGPFVHLGFTPRYLMVKRVDVAGMSWHVHDTSRDAYNDASTYDLVPNLSQAEGGGPVIDVVSNGFKIRSGGTFTDYNVSGGTYVFAAFAEFPFRYANAK